MASKKNNLSTTIILILALAGAVYIIVSKFIVSEPEQNSTNQVSQVVGNANEESNSNGNSTQNLLDTTAAEVEAENPLPSIDNLELTTQLAIKRIDANLSKAYKRNLGDKKRERLLAITEKTLDSLLDLGDNPFYHLSMGDLKILKGEYFDSERHYSKALEVLSDNDALRRNHAQACFNAAILARQQGDTVMAIGYLEKFREFSTNDDQANQLIVDCYTQSAVGLMWKGKNKKAKEMLEKAESIAPENNAVHFNLGIAYSRFNEYDKAIRHFKKCVELNPEDKNSKHYLYTIYKTRGDTINANKYKTEGVTILAPPWLK